MPSFLRPLLCATALLLTCGSAQAMSRDMVRSAQEHMANLGYFAGAQDGKIGPVTKASIKDFQRHNGLPASGKLDTRTYDLLAMMDDRHHLASKTTLPAIMGGKMIAPQAFAPMPLLPQEPQPDVWTYVGSAQLPVTSSQLTVDEEAKAGLYRFTVKLNGNPVLVADNQPRMLGISPVFRLQNEEAVMIVAARDDDNCPFRNTLVTVRADGSAASKYDFESCAAVGEVGAAHGALFVRFSQTGAGSSDGWDVWRYESGQMIRL